MGTCSIIVNRKEEPEQVARGRKGGHPPMKYRDFVKLTPAQQEAYWKAAQAAAKEKAAKRNTA